MCLVLPKNDMWYLKAFSVSCVLVYLWMYGPHVPSFVCCAIWNIFFSNQEWKWHLGAILSNTSWNIQHAMVRTQVCCLRIDKGHTCMVTAKIMTKKGMIVCSITVKFLVKVFDNVEYTKYSTMDFILVNCLLYLYRGVIM